MAVLVQSFDDATGVILLAFKLGIRKMLEAEALLDLLITGLLMVSLFGTTTGLTIALTLALITSISLTKTKRVTGHEKLIIKKDRLGKKHITWTTVPSVDTR